MGKKKDRYEFIWDAIQKHGYKYDYSKVEYKNNRTKVCIICLIHGEFWQEANSHLRGKGCPKCKNELTSIRTLSNTNEFIEKAKLVHGNKYDYSKANYTYALSKVCIICSIHGEFNQQPSCHLSGQGCPKCGLDRRTKIRMSDTEEFINKSISIHANKYDYSKVDYKGNKKKVCIICPKHGEFWQKPNDHLTAYGCPLCNESHLEKEIASLLDEHNITYERQKRFSWLGRQSLDFYLPDYKIGIECQGRQHYKAFDYFGGEKCYKDIQERDKRKLKLCNENNVKLIYYTKPELKTSHEFIDKQELLTYIIKQ